MATKYEKKLLEENEQLQSELAKARKRADENEKYR